jgi:hypothetical protein
MKPINQAKTPPPFQVPLLVFERYSTTPRVLIYGAKGDEWWWQDPIDLKIVHRNANPEFFSWSTTGQLLPLEVLDPVHSPCLAVWDDGQCYVWHFYDCMWTTGVCDCFGKEFEPEGDPIGWMPINCDMNLISKEGYSW